MQETILILDFGSQYTQLIVDRSSVGNIKGVIFSGSPFSVKDEKSPKPEVEKYKGKVPLLGVCFGAQFLANHYGGEVSPSEIREYGRARLSYVDNASLLTPGIENKSQVWMSHGDTIKAIPDHYNVIREKKLMEYSFTLKYIIPNMG